MTSARAPIRSYEDLDVYQRSMQLLKPVLDASRRLPDFEKFDLASQMRRASKSVPANIAEGYAKKRSAKEFRAYLANAMGSANEMIVHFKVARELEYLDAEECQRFIDAYEIIGLRSISSLRAGGLSTLQSLTSNDEETRPT